MPAETQANLTHKPQSSLYITLAVWRALFLREAVTRLSRERGAWVWLLVEPVIHLSVTMFIFTVIRVRVVSGMNSTIWILYGLLGMFLFMRTGTQAKNAIDANKALFAYRQVKPVDTVLSRAFLEGFLLIIIACIMFGFTYLFGIGVLPEDPLTLIYATLTLWLLGLSYGLNTSVMSELVPEFDKLLKPIMGPLYMLSGVVFPVASVPNPYREVLLYNPIAHCLEAIRAGISSYYHPFPGMDIHYAFLFALASLLFGLALQKRFAVQLVMK